MVVVGGSVVRSGLVCRLGLLTIYLWGDNKVTNTAFRGMQNTNNEIEIVLLRENSGKGRRMVADQELRGGRLFKQQHTGACAYYGHLHRSGYHILLLEICFIVLNGLLISRF